LQHSSILQDIAPGEELRVWYAKEYAAIMGTRPLAKPSGNTDFLNLF
jgi:hypothetical protein